MSKFLYSVLMFIGSLFGGNKPAKQKMQPLADSTTVSIYDITMKAIDGTSVNFSVFKGRKLLIVNVASECGYTPQYSELQKLHEDYGNKVTVIGIPSNEFGGQEPGSNEEIVNFCSKNYGVTFQLFEKSTVQGNDKCELYQWLTNPLKNGWNSQEPKWNFNKYLVSENGELLNYFPSKVSPLSEEFLSAIK